MYAKPAAILFLALAAPVYGQQTLHRTDASFDVTFANGDRTLAAEQGFGSRAIGFELGFHAAFFKVLSVSADGELGMMSDKDQFTNSTTGGTKRSSTKLFSGSVARGLRTPRIPGGDGAGFSIGADWGKAWVSGSRGIDNCTNCDEEDLKIDGGTFVEPRLIVYLSGRRMAIFAASRKYTAESDVMNRLLIGFGGGRDF